MLIETQITQITNHKEHAHYFRQKREQLESRFSSKRLKVLTAIDNYPRDIGYRRFWLAFDEENYIRDYRTADVIDPTDIGDYELTRLIRHFDSAIADIEKDAKWVKDIPDQYAVETPAPVDPEVSVPPREITRIMVNIQGGDEESITAIFDKADISEWLPEKTVDTLLRIAQNFHVSVDKQLEEIESSRGDS